MSPTPYPLNIIDVNYDGIGDVAVYAWMWHSAKAAGIANFRINPRRNTEVLYLLGVPPEGLTLEPGERFWSDKGNGSKHWHFEVEHAGTMRTRFAAWCLDHGLGEIAPVRPPYVEPPEAGAWAEKTWADRDRDSGKVTRVLVFPETYWPNRQWPIGYFKDLANLLSDSGCNVVAMLPGDKHKDGFPYYFAGVDLYRVAAMIARADLVIGADSGPAHIAGTLGIPTLAVCGPTRPEIVFGHMESVRGVSLPVEDLACIGCHFRGGKAGYRAACATGCQGLYRLTPAAVYEKARAWLDELAVEPAVVASSEGGCRGSSPCAAELVV